MKSMIEDVYISLPL